jgi:hypothetical protein
VDRKIADSHPKSAARNLHDLPKWACAKTQDYWHPRGSFVPDESYLNTLSLVQFDHKRDQTFIREMDKFGCSVRLVKTEVMGQAEKSGVMTDLNILIPRDSTLNLVEAGDINSRGEIVGQGVQKSIGELHAFLAIPCGEERSEDCEDEAEGKSAAPSGIAARPDVALSEGVRELLRQRLTPDRFGVKRQ